MAAPPPKSCVACGREITWRKKWARDWANVCYCSDACRRSAKRDAGAAAAVEAALLDLLERRGAGKTVCPSEAARAVWPGDWRDHMEDARRAARRLVAAGRAEITQGGRAVDPSRARGPIRVRLTK